MSRSLRRSVSAAIAFLALASSASGVTVAVTIAADDGAGSFRDAVAQANGNDAIDSIVFAPGLGTVVLSIANGSVVYTGEQSLTVDGNGAVITDQPGGAFDLFQSTGGADLWLREITFEGGGANGVTVGIPGDRTGVVGVELHEVVLSDNARFGLLVDDGVGDSDAGIFFSAVSTWITGNGTAVPPAANDDTDGVRINEREVGGIVAHLQDLVVTGNLYDGVELDETGDGDVTAKCRRSTFEENGAGNPADLEDGIDIDEIDGGSLDVDVFQCSALGNRDEGFDFNEGDVGNSTIRLLQAVADGNEDEGIKIEETGEGNLDFLAQNTRANDSDSQDGVEIEELGAGNFTARFVHSTVSDNDNFGVNVSQEAPGAGTLRFQGSTLEDNGDGPYQLDGVIVAKDLK